MRSSKRYTTLNFSKRVDHVAGHVSDKREREPAICERCGAIYKNGRWTFDKAILGSGPFEKIEAQTGACPACIQIDTGEPSGFVYLEGKFLIEHNEEIENLLRNEEQKLWVTNPLARIMDWKKAGNRLTVATTTEHLAQHLGRALKRAYSGDVRYAFSHENKLTRVYWHRD